MGLIQVLQCLKRNRVSLDFDSYNGLENHEPIPKSLDTEWANFNAGAISHQMQKLSKKAVSRYKVHGVQTITIWLKENFQLEMKS